MTGTRRTLRAFVITLLAAAATAAAQEPLAEAPSAPASVPSAASASYTLEWVVLDASAAGEADSTSYRVEATVGQSVIGVTSGPGGSAELGFWYGLAHRLFSDGFESGDTTAWDSTVGG
jgi:hypothetical protein